MDIKLLKAMAALADQGSYRLAAEVLCISQPALTKQIQLLELQFGFPVFIRGRHGATLTTGGQRLYARAKSLLGEYDALLLHAGYIAAGSAGELALGFGLSFFGLAPQVIMAFRERFPGVSIRLDDIPSDVQCADIRAGRLHAGFVRLPVVAPLDAVALLTEKLLLAVPAMPALAIPDNQPELAMAKHPLLQLAPHRGRGLATQINRYLASRAIAPAVGQYASDIHTLLALVAAGNGCALIPQGALSITPPGIRFVHLSGPHTSWQAGLAWNSEIRDPLRDNFIKTARQIAGELTPGRQAQ
ncbi:LysR substrate-binding domain-containing protein [Gibbsiella quercinecans]|uniref:LysR family transcriptional regulator n=1 Tax=Gibbsiella quercinecans TaxID=929813 RepID=UPI003A4E0084